ncbi:MAG: sigma-54 dependent transcriptional regulator [Candidatus Muiribacteriota bacterium]
MDGLIGVSRNINDVRRLIDKAADCDIPVLISGDSGTGKEVIARTIFEKSSKKIFIPLNCGAIPRDLVESELFGYRKGAFSGAVANYNGKIGQAHRGILFLDEIGEMDLSIQPKFLRVLQNREYTPLGSSETLNSDFRLISATNKNIDKYVSEKKFREDLFYRINTLVIKVKPLKERKEDIMPLINFFINKYNIKFNRKIQKITADLEKLVLNYDWPGNVRELQSFIEKEVFFSQHNIINHIPDFLKIKKTKKKIDEYNLKIIEKKIIMECLENNRNNYSVAAELLGISRATLYRKLKEYEINED